MHTGSVIAALIGAGVGPSLTPHLHEREARRHGLNYAYRSVDITALGLPPQDVGKLVDSARKFGFDGLNITHPCKRAVIPHLEVLAPEAESVGAVNTIVFEGDRTVGQNTDVTGFAQSFVQGLPDAGLRAVVQVGAGGAGAAVAHALLNLGAEQLLVADLNASRTATLAESLRDSTGEGRVHQIQMSDIPDALTTADGLVNTTPLGMVDHPGSAVSSEQLRPELWVADIVYRPLRTELVRTAEEVGCRVLTGAGMAVHQAVGAFALITGREPDVEAMFADFEALVADEISTDSTMLERNP